uniref:Uncharacterized protein n=1 Tax=Globodera rostochiensis TaxID=31243 RepID=A0A914GSV2_GLORO
MFCSGNRAVGLARSSHSLYCFKGKDIPWKGREGKGREGKGREGKGREGKGRGKPRNDSITERFHCPMYRLLLILILPAVVAVLSASAEEQQQSEQPSGVLLDLVPTELADNKRSLRRFAFAKRARTFAFAKRNAADGWGRAFAFAKRAEVPQGTEKRFAFADGGVRRFAFAKRNYRQFAFAR